MSHFFFFFSSRRRHTRCYRDWSSDVCSSDLGLSIRSVGRGKGYLRSPGLSTTACGPEARTRDGTMTGFKKLVGVTLAVVLVAAVAAFVLRPNTGPNTSAVINDPEADDPGTDPAANDPPKPERLSNGPNPQGCVPQTAPI